MNPGIRILCLVILLLSGSTVLKSSGINHLSLSNPESFKEDTINITFIANSGFILSWGTHKIALDALFEGSHTGMHVEPSTEAISGMQACEGEFQDIDLVCVTHEHSDHISTDIVSENLLCNNEAYVICDSIVAKTLKENELAGQTGSRIIERTPDLYCSITDTINEIPVKIFRFRHGKSMFYDLVNLAFLIDINGTRIFHAGDAQGEYLEELEELHLETENIDIAFLHLDFMYASVDGQVSEGLEKVKRYLSPDNIILMHNNPSYLNGGYDIIDSVRNEFPNIFIFDDEGEKRQFINGNFIDQSVNINPDLFQDEVFVYPNPAQDIIYIQTGLPNPPDILYEIITTDGRIINNGCLINAVVDISSLNSGIYFLRYIVDNNAGYRMILKK